MTVYVLSIAGEVVGVYDEYIKALAKTVLEEKLGGEELSKELADKLTRVDGIKRQRLVPFIEHWFKNDPTAKLVINESPITSEKPIKPTRPTVFAE